MSARHEKGRFASAYAKFRGSPAFLITLATYVLLWLVWNVACARGYLSVSLSLDTPGDWGTLNLILSIEASISMALLLMDNAKCEANQHRQLETIQHLAEASIVLLEAERRRDPLAHGGPAPDGADASLDPNHRQLDLFR